MTSTKTVASTETTEANVIEVDFRPVVVSYTEASTPKSEIAKTIAAEAAAQSSKLASSADKKAGTLRILASGRGDVLNVNPYLLTIKENWNSREANDPANLAHIDSLARSFVEIGVQVPLAVVVEGDKVVVTDGHCRLLGVFRAIEVYGAEIRSVKVITESRFATEADRVLSQIVRNSGKPLTVLEQGTVFVKLVNLGWSPKQIADKAGVGVVRITQILDLMAGANDGIKALVSSGKISPTTAALALKTHDGDADAAEAALTGAVETAVAAGKTKATPKHLKATGEKSTKKTNTKASLRAVFDDKTTEVDTTSGEEVTIKISADNWKVLAALLNI
ncbi:unnamed protein product [Sphagnum tenellum]